MNYKELARMSLDLQDASGCESEEAYRVLQDSGNDYSKALRAIMSKRKRADWCCPKCDGGAFYEMNFVHDVSVDQQPEQSRIEARLLLTAYNCEQCDFVELYRSPRDRCIRSNGERHVSKPNGGPYR